MKKTVIIIIILMCALAFANACTNGDTRLFDARTISESDKGMLQMCNSYGQWTAVCDYDWTQYHSIVACKQLGYSNPNPLTRINAGEWIAFGFGPYSNCHPSYTSLSQCSHYSSSIRTNPSYCNIKKDTVELQCYVNTTSDCTYGDIRLYNNIKESTVSDDGMLQVCDGNNAEWTAVCDYNWGCSHAVVACKQLGFSNPKPLYFVNNGSWPIFGFGPYSYCSFSYSSLFQCSSYSSYYKTHISYCDSIRDTVSLYCSPIPNNRKCETNYEVRLIGGNDTSEGIVEICFGGVWNSFCSSYGSTFDYQIAATICYQLGYRKNFSIFRDGRFGRVYNTQYITYSHCNYPYQQLERCSFSQHHCGLHCSSSYHHISLKCYEPGNCNEGDIRLVNGTVERQGRLEICAKGVWGTICPSFSKSSGYVACKQLGYDDTNGAVITTWSVYGDGSQPPLYGSFDCFGHESTLTDCTESQYTYPNTYCSRTSFIGLVCYSDCEEGDVRLTGSGHHFEGFVEICLNKMWGLISQSGWNDNDAKVVCIQLGYSGNATLAVFNSSVSKPRRPVHYSNVNCYGTESKLWDCKHHRYNYITGQPSVTYQNTEVAGVNCQSNYRSSNSVNPTDKSSQEQAANNMLISGIVFQVTSIIVMFIGIIAVVIVSIKMKKISKSINKYLVNHVPMNKQKHKGQGHHNHPRPPAHPPKQQDNNTIYYDLK